MAQIWLVCLIRNTAFVQSLCLACLFFRFTFTSASSSQANLAVQENRLAIANADLQKAQAELDAKQAELDVVQGEYEKAMIEKQVSDILRVCYCLLAKLVCTDR